MHFFKRPHVLRRYKNEPVYEQGYVSLDYEDMVIMADFQTTENVATTDGSGTQSTQRLKVFCDTEILCEDSETSQKGDRVFHQGKWFDCISSRLSENTPLIHWTATFVQCNEQEAPPEIDLAKGHYNRVTGEWEQ